MKAEGVQGGVEEGLETPVFLVSEGGEQDVRENADCPNGKIL